LPLSKNQRRSAANKVPTSANGNTKSPGSHHRDLGLNKFVFALAFLSAIPEGNLLLTLLLLLPFFLSFRQGICFCSSRANGTTPSRRIRAKVRKITSDCPEFSKWLEAGEESIFSLETEKNLQMHPYELPEAAVRTKKFPEK
jgi:hypothetical protein